MPKKVKKDDTVAKVETKKVRTKYAGGVLVLDKKNLLAIYNVLSDADTTDLDDDAVTAIKKATNKVRKEYQKYQKSLPKDKRDVKSLA